MAYPVSHLLLRAHGTFGSSGTDQVEFFSYGMRINIGTSDHTEENKATFLNNVRSPFTSFQNSTSFKAHGASYLQKITAAYIDLDGRYEGGEDQPTTELPMISPVKGGGLSTHSFAHAMAVTLRTDIERGPGSKGRFYVPSGLAVGTGGSWTLVEAAAARDAAVTLLNAINTAARAIWIPSAGVAVISNTREGFLGHVLDVSVGRAPDTQRRRDNRVPEEHTYAPLATAAAYREARAARNYGG